MNFKKSVLALTLFLVSFIAFSQNRLPDLTLNDSSTISLITASPGRQIYTHWGHSAIRVHDPSDNLDLVFNYGTFDFDTPGFVLKFMRGKLPYALSVYEFKNMPREYSYFNQALIEQTLNLSTSEKQKVYDFLIRNYTPENRYYMYDFFYDNCSSRIRDLFKTTLGDTLVFRNYLTEKKTLRDMVDSCLVHSPWLLFGIDLILGLPADRKANTWNSMFLPEYLMKAFAHAVIIRDGQETEFARPGKIILPDIPVKEEPALFTPLRVSWGFFVFTLLLILVQLVRKNTAVWFDTIIFSLSGLIGLFILFMWFGTDHLATKDNLNFLWLMPLNILVPFALIKNPKGKLLNIYLMLSLGVNISLLMAWKLLPQPFNLAVIPLILVFIFRSIYLLFVNYRPEKLNLKPENHVDRNGQ